MCYSRLLAALVSKEKTMSPVWTYFGLEKDEGGRLKLKRLLFAKNARVTCKLRGAIPFSFKDAPSNSTWACLWRNGDQERTATSYMFLRAKLTTNDHKHFEEGAKYDRDGAIFQCCHLMLIEG